VTVSKWLKGKVEQSFLQKHKVSFIWNGVDEKKFIIQAKNEALLKKYQLKNKRILLAASTSWSKQKGFDDYLKLAQYLKDEVIVLIGLPYYMRLQLPNNIIAVDRTESVEELASWYATADVVLNLSNQETFGLTNVEAFMCGKPVVAYNTTASPEIVSNETVGRIIEYGNITALYNAIQALLSANLNPQHIRAYAVENFALNKQIGAYIDLYRSLLFKNNEPLL
jgi:glycosyltransferase involved in cell wall biosynthesis